MINPLNSAFKSTLATFKIPNSKPQPVRQYAFHYPTKFQLFFAHHLLSQQTCFAVPANPSHPNSNLLQYQLLTPTK